MRGLNGSGAGMPALRLDWGLGRESVYLLDALLVHFNHLTAWVVMVGTYLANALDRAFLQLIFWLPMKESTVTAMARSMSCAEQYSESRILQKDSAIRMMASR